jgi:YD repeat-containing protein
MAHYFTLVPAYGRDYKTAAATVAAWDAGKDFIIADISHRYDGKPISTRDAPGTHFQIRYNGARRLVRVTSKGQSS